MINIASVNGMGAYGHPAYSAAKAGMIQFTRLVAVEYGKFGLRANTVAPGSVRTKAWKTGRRPILTFSRRCGAGTRSGASP